MVKEYFIEMNFDEENISIGDVLQIHFPKHLFNSVLKYVDDVKYLDNSHLLIVKSPVSGLCLIEPTEKESYHIVRVIEVSSLKLDVQSKMV